MAATTKTWVNNNPPTVEDDDLNGFKTENNNLIAGSGQALNTGDLQQTNKAVAHYAAAGQIYVDSGATDAYVLSAGDARIGIPAYKDRAKFLFVPSNPNTVTGSTVNIGGLGVKALKDENGDILAAGRLTDKEVTIEYILGADEFRLVPPKYVPTIEKTSSYTAITGDHLRTIEVTGTTTINLAAAASMPDGYTVTIKNTGAGTVTVDASSAGGTIDGGGDKTLAVNDSITLQKGTNSGDYNAIAAYP